MVKKAKIGLRQKVFFTEENQQEAQEKWQFYVLTQLTENRLFFKIPDPSISPKKTIFPPSFLNPSLPHKFLYISHSFCSFSFSQFELIKIYIQSTQQSMLRIFVIIPLQLIFIGLAVYYFSGHKKQLNTYSPIPICLQTETVHKLCAQCYTRDQKTILKDKGYHVLAQGSASVLKIKSNIDVLSCAEMLQLIDFNKDHVGGDQFHLDTVDSIAQVTAVLEGHLSFKKMENYDQSQYVVEPQYERFVVYKWKQYSKEGQVSVTSVDSDFYIEVNQNLLYLLNFVLLTVFVAWMADHQFISDLTLPFKLALICMIICCELSLLDIWRGGFHWLARLFFLNLGLIKLRVNNFKVLAYLGLGLLMTYFPLTLCIYNGFMTILVAYYGKEQSQARSSKLYLVIFYTILMLNYSYWYRYVLYINDVSSLVIEFCSFMLVPIGLFLLPNQRQHEKIHDKDPEIRSISLSGFDDEDDGR